MRPLTAIVFSFILATAARAQVFSVLPEGPPLVGNGTVAGPRPTSGAVVSVDADALGALLDLAPLQNLDVQLETYGLLVSLPDPNGHMVPCRVARSPVMEAPLQALFPQIQTFLVQSDDKSANGRLELSPRGLTGMLRTPEGVWMIDPWQSADPFHAVAYWLRDLPGGSDWVCLTTEGVHGFGFHVDEEDGGFSTRAFQTLRTVRLAIACTGEYGLHHSTIQGHAANIADPLAAIVTIVGRTNVVYEADLAIHFNLVATNNLIIFTDPNTDPYDATCDGGGGADCSGNLLGPNIDLLDAVIGDANFDVGHVVTRVAGGVAYLQSVCSGYKAGGVSGIPRGGDIDPFSALVVIHELGHQFGANHTFSGTRGRCAGNVHLSTAWEAGSGSSPMAYAGGCPVGDAPPSDNVAQFADPFFHHGSLLEMLGFLSSATCPVQASTSNNIPSIVSSSPSAPIPPGTPFVLSVSATDADGETLTYSWEQRDTDVARPLIGPGSEDNGAGALFRAFPPVLSPQRTFPRMADVLLGEATPGEQLPTVTGATRRFRVVVRDNHPGSGGIAISSSSVVLTIQSGTTPFTVVSPAQGTVLQAGPNTVTWTVGGTNLSPISCSSVNISLSTDHGATFSQNLGNFPNNGSASVNLPSINGTAPARIRVSGVGKIFFNVSRGFVLQGTCPGDFNHDGFLDPLDYNGFINAFEAGSIAADFNGDGFIDPLDYNAFINAFESGC